MNNQLDDIADTVLFELDLDDMFGGESQTTAILGIRAIDVGQGDCIGLINQRNEVFGYVDFGGFIDHPDIGKSGKNPSKDRMPVVYGDQQYVVIILTHWDLDHWWSAKSKNEEAQKCRWIVPRQYVSPSATQFATSLKNARRWPEQGADNIGAASIGNDHILMIRKCGAFDKDNHNADRNLTGLAVTIEQLDYEDGGELMLLPGDCPFDKVPHWDKKLAIKGLVAYHHGSNTHRKDETKQAIANMASDAKLIYSVSVKNHYGHPDETKYSPEWDECSYKTSDIRDTDDSYIEVRFSYKQSA